MLTWETSNKHRVICVCWCRCWVWALGFHLVPIYCQLKAMFDLVGPDFVPLSVTQMPWDPSIIDSSESAGAIVHMKHNLESRKLHSQMVSLEGYHDGSHGKNCQIYRKDISRNSLKWTYNWGIKKKTWQKLKQKFNDLESQIVFSAF